ncbi:MAG: cytochrome c3 family protein, partial [Mariprofundales bacterium]|nr:cytochrome c3 family protein [Mariprofundales bacterium]
NISERGTNFVNELSEGYNFGNYPANIHWDHLDMHGINYDQMWDSNQDGTLDSMTSCTACHDPHGNTSRPALTHDDLGIEYSTDANGDYGIINNSEYQNPGGDTYCNACHSTGSKYYRTPKNIMTDCINCHAPGDVNVSLFARHANLNTSDGLGVVSNFDCWTCHYQQDMNRSHVYLCDACHLGGGVVPVNDSSLIITGLKHGLNNCKDCHAPDTYHVSGTVGPRGRVENPGWGLISPVDYAGCNDCHYNYNGQDAPFHAPGKDHYNTGGKDNGSGCSFSCHGSPTDPHSVNVITGTWKPVVSVSLSNATVNAGEPVTLNATASDNMMQVELMRYQLRDSNGGIIIPWSELAPADGRFNSKSETGTVTINTTTLHGNYTVEVQAMAGAPRTTLTQRYYPDNGDWSNTQTTTLTVTRSGYIDAGGVDEQGYLWSAKRSGLLGSDRFDFGGTPETTVRFESDGDIVYRFGWLNQSAQYKV